MCIRRCLITAVAAFAVAVSAATQAPPEIPHAWSAEGVATFELPLASREHSPVHISPDYYYQLPVRPVYRSYPIYHPDRGPDGYQQGCVNGTRSWSSTIAASSPTVSGSRRVRSSSRRRLRTMLR